MSALLEATVSLFGVFGLFLAGAALWGWLAQIVTGKEGRWTR